MELVTIWKRVVLENYANFAGRARRREYWLFQVANAIVVLVLAVLAKVSGVFVVLLFAYYIGLLVPSIAVAVRRMHDVGKSGWFLLVALVPLAGSLVLLWFAVKDSDRSVNAYGSSPKFG